MLDGSEIILQYGAWLIISLRDYRKTKVALFVHKWQSWTRNEHFWL